MSSTRPIGDQRRGCSCRGRRAGRPGSRSRGRRARSAQTGIVIHIRALMVRGSSAIEHGRDEQQREEDDALEDHGSASIEVGERPAGQRQPEPHPVLLEVVPGVTEVRRAAALKLDIRRCSICAAAAARRRGSCRCRHRRRWGRRSRLTTVPSCAVHRVEPLCGAPAGAQEVVAGRGSRGRAARCSRWRRRATRHITRNAS